MLRPTAIEVKPCDNYELIIKFNNNETRLYDVKRLLEYPVFKPLKEKKIFETVHTNGITIEWQNEIDIYPDELYYIRKLVSN
mgnify:CR=1 FL=1